VNFEQTRQAALASACSIGGLALLLWGQTVSADAPGPSSPPSLLTRVAGGYGSLAADWFWLETNLAWERRDAAETRRLLNRTVSVDPRSVYFWLNGARMLAYDLPAWRQRDEPDAPTALQQRWRLAGADEAIGFLERGLEWHGGTAALYLELGHISRHGRRDRRRAADYYRRAAACPDAPADAARFAQAMAAETR
jgi:hypothetical protein